jgi:ferrochelatase
MKTAVLLMAYGGPDSLDDVPAYLLDIRGGRETPQRLVDEITERYRQIGGRSPLLDITRSTAAKLSSARPPRTSGCVTGIRSSTTVAQMAADGIRCTAIRMAPHYSTMSIGAYRAPGRSTARLAEPRR